MQGENCINTTICTVNMHNFPQKDLDSLTFGVSDSAPQASVQVNVSLGYVAL